MKTKIYQVFDEMRNLIKRLAFPVIGIATIVAFAASPIFFGGAASALGQVTSRSIEMSSDAASATLVSYLVTYTPSAAETIKGIIVDFCTVDPIANDTCTAPTGMSLGTPTTTTPANITGTWASSIIGATGGLTLALTESGVGGVYSAGAVSFTASGITNPSTNNTTFYARIFDFDTAAGATGYLSTNDTHGGGNLWDFGGVAITTSNQIVITSRVQETITFCIYAGSACTGDSISLGNASDVLSASGPYVDITSRFEIQTNAGTGVTIRMVGVPLTSGGNTIESSGASGTGSVAGNEYSSTTGSPQFGFCAYEASGTTISIASTYGNGTGTCSSASQTSGTGSTGGTGTAQFGFNITNAALTYGDTVATATAGSIATAGLNFMANISTSTPAGIYTTSLTFIATGIY